MEVNFFVGIIAVLVLFLLLLVGLVVWVFGYLYECMRLEYEPDESKRES